MGFETYREQHEFHCQPCNYVWQVTYEVRNLEGHDSRQYFYLSGLPASSPAEGRLCPNCWEPTHASHRIDGQVPAPSPRTQARKQLV